MKVCYVRLARFFRMWTAVILVMFSISVFASECKLVDQEIKDELIDIRESLASSTSVQSFKATINERYDIVEARIKELDSCFQAGSEDAVKLADLKQILLQLRADARQLVFLKYENWRQVRNNELTLLKNVEMSASVAVKPIKVTPAARSTSVRKVQP